MPTGINVSVQEVGHYSAIYNVYLFLDFYIRRTKTVALT